MGNQAACHDLGDNSRLKISENLDKSKRSLYNRDKQEGKKKPADEVPGICSSRKRQKNLYGKEENPMGL